MKSVQLVGFVALLCLCFISQGAFAGIKPATHNGFFIGFGVGGASAGFSLDDSDFDFDRETGLSVDIRLGTAIANNILIGVEMDAWRKEEGGFVLQYNNYAAAVTFYPVEMFFIKAGPALSIVLAEAFGFTDTDTGFGFTGGAGVEVRLTDKFALVPSVQYAQQFMDGYSTNFISGLLGFNWFW